MHMRQAIRAEAYAVKLLFEASVPLAIVFILSYAVDYPIVLFGTYLWKLIIDQLSYVYVNGTGAEMLWGLIGLYLTINVVNSLIGKLNFTVVRPRILSKSQRILDVRVMEKAATLDAEFFDDPANRDMVDVASHSKQQISNAMTFLIREMIGIVTFASSLVMFIMVSPIVSIIYLTTCIPGIIIEHCNKSKMDRFSISSVPESRKKDYYRSILTGKEYAEDLRLYGLAGYFKEKYNELWNKIREKRYVIFKKGNRLLLLSTFISSAGKIFLIAYSVYEVAVGNYTIGTLSMLLALSGKVGGKFQTLVKAVPDHYRITLPRIHSFLCFMNYENKIKATGSLKIDAVPEIEFRDVCFRYPECEHNAIDHLNLKIPANKKIALVGLNGAGKTTIVKLLLRFYEPQSGHILIDGKDISEYSAKELYGLFGVCFQNVNKYAMTLRENIAISDIGRINDQADIKNAAAAAGADRICEELPGGLDADLTRRFKENGAELSGGQWQKIALARTFFRNSRFIILDEPSSALDPVAEDHIFSSFKKICADKGGILISHRLSSIMMVDEVVLLKEGSVAESGTHDELMELNGEYAALYRMQAEKYVRAGGIYDA